MEPFRNMSEWKKNMDSFFGENFWSEFDDVLKPPVPQINLYQYQNELVCYVSLPGVSDLEKIDVEVDYATLQLKGVIDLKHHGGQVIKDEIIHGAFDRLIDLPFPVRNDKVTATYAHGLLVIHMHRLIREDHRGNKLKIKNLEDE